MQHEGCEASSSAGRPCCPSLACRSRSRPTRVCQRAIASLIGSGTRPTAPTGCGAIPPNKVRARWLGRDSGAVGGEEAGEFSGDAFGPSVIVCGEVAHAGSPDLLILATS